MGRFTFRDEDGFDLLAMTVLHPFTEIVDNENKPIGSSKTGSVPCSKEVYEELAYLRLTWNL